MAEVTWDNQDFPLLTYRSRIQAGPKYRTGDVPPQGASKPGFGSDGWSWKRRLALISFEKINKSVDQ
jgi:hypothetical protein